MMDRELSDLLMRAADQLEQVAYFLRDNAIHFKGITLYYEGAEHDVVSLVQDCVAIANELDVAGMVREIQIQGSERPLRTRPQDRASNTDETRRLRTLLNGFRGIPPSMEP